MAKGQVRVAGVLSACILAGVAGVLWAEDVPPASEPQREADEAEVEALNIEVFSEQSEENGDSQVIRDAWEAWAAEARREATEAENEIPGSGT